MCIRDSYGISIESPLKETSWKEMASDSPERQGAGRIFMKLSAGSSVNIRPEQVIGAYYESLGQEYPTFAFQIQREEVYGDQGSDSCHRFIPLEEYGEEIIE